MRFDSASFRPPVVLLLAPLLIGSLCAAGRTGPPSGFDDWSDGATLRLDYQHSGRLPGAGGGAEPGETFALDGLRREGPWPGSRANLVDALNLGEYRFEVRDRATNRALYAQGFSSIYAEWETTDEAAVLRRSFGESLRFPFPKRPVQVVVQRRQRTDQSLREVASFVVDPAAREVRRDPITSRGTVWTLFENGPAERKVDLLVLGDGYGAQEMGKFHDDAKRLVETLFATPPFRERRGDFNVRAIDTPSEDSGVDRPSDGVFRRSALNLTYDIFGSERYALTLDNIGLRETAAQAPYEFIEILINGEKYGGGGIYNLYATCATRSGSTSYIFVHEFGHHFAGLADEYYTSEVAYDTTTAIVEPWEPNITAATDRAAIKWGDLIAPGTPVPTPWDKEEYEAFEKGIQERRRALRARQAPEAEMDALFAEELAFTRPHLAKPPHGGQVGVFEGGGYRAKGLYRCTTDCIMFTRNRERFCPACARGIERVIDWATGR